jgi:CheY-like chemotaxis protein
LLWARTDPLLPPAPFIVVSRDASRRFHERCRRRGADAVIGKPVATADFARAVTMLVARTRSRPTVARRLGRQ